MLVKELKESLKVALWFMFLTLPLVVVKVDIGRKELDWRWENLLYMGIGAFFVSLVWRYLLKKRQEKKQKEEAPKTAEEMHQMEEEAHSGFLDRLMHDPKLSKPAIGIILALAIVLPFLTDSYQVSILSTALMFMVLGLGLNIVVGLAGLLDLGYVAFYAVGAYAYALLNMHFGLGFWSLIPIAAVLAGVFGIMLGIPVLRLRGDYLAIVTLGFGEIIRLVLQNWSEFSQGPRGIPNIPRPSFFGVQMDVGMSTTFIYFLLLAMAALTIFVVRRLNMSRIGRAWVALREDELACEAMGIDTMKTKLTAFALGASFAGVIGVFFAAKNTFVNPDSFQFLQSAMILAIVVLGGMGSIVGVMLAALILMLLPEYLRVFAEYRMLIFGAAMVVMMVFKPEGLISNIRQKYEFKGLKKDNPDTV
jgi:branched-chain amino acid transport system permease protein